MYSLPSYCLGSEPCTTIIPFYYSWRWGQGGGAWSGAVLVQLAGIWGLWLHPKPWGLLHPPPALWLLNLGQTGVGNSSSQVLVLYRVYKAWWGWPSLAFFLFPFFF